MTASSPSPLQLGTATGTVSPGEDQGSSVEGVPALGWSWMRFKVPSKPSQSVILWFYERALGYSS